MILIRKGTVVRGCYAGGEWCERDYAIEATGETREALDEDVRTLTNQFTDPGSKIDYGFTSGTSTVSWDDEILEVVVTKVSD